MTKSFQTRFRKLEVLKHLDLDVPRGDFRRADGPSGSGKTTLLNILGGIDRPTSGEVLIDGIPLQRMNEGALTRWRARHVGFVFQLYHLLPALTAEENVALPLILKAERRRKKAACAQHLRLSALRSVRATSRENCPAVRSSGSRIARAIVTDPTILLCDEPTGDFDRKAGDEILHLLHLLNRDHGKTIVMVTHDPRAAARAQHTLFMDKGVLCEEPETVQ